LTLCQLNGIERTFGAVKALRPLDLTIYSGDYLAITGPSGSGKSTLLQILGLLDRPTSGGYRFEGKDVIEMHEDFRAGLRSTAIGFVFQSFHLIPTRSSIENVELGLLYRSINRKERRIAAHDALERVGMVHRESAFPTTLSGGERQRVAIARAIAGGAKLLLADEPTGNLDSVTGEKILELFRDLNDAGLTLVVITHDLNVAKAADRHLRLKDGRLLAESET
jgi:putative ABC transport system ATP-binding protein